MSSSYDERIFERDRWSFAPSQRFSQLWHDFRGTFKLAIQSVSANFLQRTLPRYLSRMLFFNFLFFSLILVILLIHELLPSSRTGRQEDRDLFDVIKKLATRGRATMVAILVLVILLGESFNIYIELNFQVNELFLLVVFGVSFALVKALVKIPWD